MVEIISKSGGPRREDARVKHLIEQNRATITRIADHISAGSYSVSKAARPKRQAEGLIIHVGSRTKPVAEVKPNIRISLNGRVVAVDQNTGRQLHHIGELRRRDGVEIFVLATKANQFFSPVDDNFAAALLDLDGTRLGPDYGEDRLVADIGKRLGMS